MPELTYLTRQYTGILKEYVHDPLRARETELEHLQRDKEAEIAKKELRRYTMYSENRDWRGRIVDDE